MHYHVSLYDLELGGAWGYKGIVRIDSTITRPTQEVVLNCKEIEVHKAEILGKDGSSKKQHPHLNQCAAVDSTDSDCHISYFRYGIREGV